MDDDAQTPGMAVIENAWETICSFEWLLAAHRNARKKKRTRPEVMAFTARLEDHLLEIQEKMLDGSYELGPYRRIWVYIPKKRIVMALPYPDRVVQWAVYQYLNPFYDKLFISDSYACRVGKGSHKAIDRLQYWLRQIDRKPDGKSWYYLKLDISKYFYRVDHEKLLRILERRIKDPKLMAFIRKIVNSKAEPFGLPRWRKPEDTPPEEWLYEVGMPIGNLTSQLFANIYLNELDQYCKHGLRIHYYIRYMDDIIILGRDKKELAEIEKRIAKFLMDELALDLNDKTCIRPVRGGIEFAGTRVTATKKKLRKSTVRRQKREARAFSAKFVRHKMTPEQFRCRVESMKGLLKHVDSKQLRMRLNEIYQNEARKAREEREAMSNLQMIEQLEGVVEMQAGLIKVLATRLAELGDTETGRDEIAAADERYREVLGAEADL